MTNAPGFQSPMRRESKREGLQTVREETCDYVEVRKSKLLVPERGMFPWVGALGAGGHGADQHAGFLGFPFLIRNYDIFQSVRK